jgi:predicted esterase
LVIASCIAAVSAVSAEDEDGTHPAMRESEDTIVFFEPPRVLAPQVTFLSRKPDIDGLLDSELHDLPVREFSRVAKSAPENPIVPCDYRIAYGTHFFYAYIEADGERLAFRDRAYQNGDGFAMVLCLPTPDDRPTDDFYVLACSAVDDPRLEWTRHVFWYYNVKYIFLRTGDDTQLEFAAKDGRISFELYLPWTAVRPYHPWISESIGFNLMFTKAIGEEEANWYRVIPGTVGGENLPRWYAHLDFEAPKVHGAPQTFVSTNLGNTYEGTPVDAIAVTAASLSVPERIDAEVREEDGVKTGERGSEYRCDPGVTRYEFEVLPGDLPQGDYVVDWKALTAGNEGEIKVTVLPRFDPDKMRRKLAEAEGRVPPGSFTTLEFKIQRLEGLLEALPPYEVASAERRVFERVTDQLDQAHRGQDPYATVTGPLGRAFRSKLDDTLQPYAVRIPETYESGRDYPLLVFLHGSGSTETDILGFPFLSPGGMIEIGPFGRGPSNGFATPEAQTDIAEAMYDAIANYPVDVSRIILTGFSMGGYGAYRTFFETPERYAAVAVFSGGPELGRAFAPENDPPSFLDEESLKPFGGVPIFIYHGEKDLNVSYNETLTLVEKLRAAGALVEFHSDPDRGHDGPPDEIIGEYHRWLRSVLDL